ARALDARRRRPELFAEAAGYAPLEAKGLRAQHVVGFVRGGGAVTVVPRLVLGLGDPPGWGDTRMELPDGRWRDVLSGRTLRAGPVAVADLLREFPVA